MSYMHIENLYKNQTILLFRECYALEKVHGTSAHIKWTDGRLKFFSGEASHERFVELFDEAKLRAAFEALGHDTVIVYGEAYGGKIQSMKDTYGDKLDFIVFDVKIGDAWLDVPDADDVVKMLGLEFVPWVRVATNLADLDAQRDAPSVVSLWRVGNAPTHPREGIVLRPIHEMFDKRGSRVIAKYKGAAFAETKTPRPVVDPSQQQVLDDANKIADEWVTDMRLAHVLDKCGAKNVSDTLKVINAMLEDVLREAKGEIVDTKEARRAIGKRTAQLFHACVKRTP